MSGRRSQYWLSFVTISILSMIFLLTATAKALVFETFDGNLSKWRKSMSGSGMSDALIFLHNGNRVLQFFVSAAAKSNGLPNGKFENLYRTVCSIRGDFILTADYNVTGMPPRSGVRTSLGLLNTLTGLQVMHVERAGYKAGDVVPNGGEYVTASMPGRAVPLGVSSWSGKFTLVRAGSRISVWHTDAFSNRSIVTFETSYTGPVQVYIGTHSRDAVFSDVNSWSYFDNIIIQNNACK